MPNGYTALIYEDDDDKITFEDYMLECTRAFSARISERDDAHTAANRKPTLPIEPDISYYEGALQDACEELSEINSLSMDEYIIMRKAEIDSSNQSTVEYNKKNARLSDRYDRMVDAVAQWKPPSDDHVDFKDFMMKQLAESKDFDCQQSSLSSYPTDWVEDRRQRTKHLSDNVENYEGKIAEAIKRAESATEWLRAIVESIE